MNKVLRQLLAKILEFNKKKEDLDEEFEERLRKSKPINIEFQKRRIKVDGQLLAYKESVKMIKKEINGKENEGA